MPALGLLGADDPLHKPLDLADPLATVQRVVLGFPTAADTGPKLRPASPTGEAIPQPSVGDRGSFHSHGSGASGHPGSGKPQPTSRGQLCFKVACRTRAPRRESRPRRPTAFSRTK